MTFSKTKQTTILIVDEVSITELMSKLLDMIGYRSIVTDKADEGYLRYFTYQSPVDLIIIGLFLPNWTVLRGILRKEKPCVKILFTSGYNFLMLVGNGYLNPDDHFLQKPFEIEEFYRKIREVLDR
ncbi:MAG: hypothetical protein P9M15_03785 [Candidatus Electryoneaceae bacterium]|nr:hypothetical protein [Candidatus Electryoneaceae bacterium]